MHSQWAVLAIHGEKISSPLDINTFFSNLEFGRKTFYANYALPSYRSPQSEAHYFTYYQ